MREKNMEEVEKMLEEMQKMLRDMREALKTPNKQQDDYIPLK